MELRTISNAIFLLVICFGINYSASEVFTALTEMEELLVTELALINNLESFISTQEIKLDFLKQKVQEYQKEHLEAKDDVGTYLANPINAYLLTKRLTSDWKQIENLIQDESTKAIENITNYKNVLKFPSDEDLNGAAVALMRLQDTYNLDTSSVARGELNGIQYSVELSSNDCFELGRQSYLNADHYHTVLWMKEALEKLDLGTPTYNSTKVQILEYLSYSVYKNGDLNKAFDFNESLLDIEPENDQGKNNRDWYLKLMKAKQEEKEVLRNARGDDGSSSMPVPQNFKVERIEASDYKNYEMLCRGEVHPTSSQLEPLRCRYIHNNVPFLKLGPMKMEEMSLDPLLVLFHDVMYDNEIKTAIEIGKPRLKRATVKNGDGYAPAQYRISKSGWISHDENKTINTVVQRISYMTMLDMESAEDLQVCNYGIGGHYEPHFDFSSKLQPNSTFEIDGNRLATVLIYMSDVAQGGATVFPRIGKTIWPNRGSAAFWFNLEQNGDGDSRTQHAACPVLAGNKWVANLWIHERGQQGRSTTKFMI